MGPSRRAAVIGLIAAIVLSTTVLSRPAQATTDTFTTVGASTWTIPAGVTSATFEVWGAEGGAGSGTNAGAGGLGGKATVTIPVTPGETIRLYVGAKGSAGVGGTAGAGGAGGNGDAAGGRGGGAGVAGGGGGGGSDVRRGGTARANIVIAAGGGGGGGGRSLAGIGGTGGAGSGHAASNGGNGAGATSNGGGGVGATLSTGYGILGAGSEGDTFGTDGTSGGGGGGGYFGGRGGGAGISGAGATGGGGGGGSGFATAAATSVALATGVDAANSGNGKIVITYGTVTVTTTQTTERVSVSSAGAQADAASTFAVRISGNSRYVVFESNATNLVTGDTNGFQDVFLRDSVTGTTERISVSSTGVQGTRGGAYFAVSHDGRYVAFGSESTNIVGNKTTAHRDVFLRDRSLSTTTKLSVPNGGGEADFSAFNMSIGVSDAAVVIAWQSGATNLVAGDTNGVDDIFVRAFPGAIERVSVSTSGTQADGRSVAPSVSLTGRYVVFSSEATNLVTGDTNGFADAFVRDRQTGTTERISVSSAGAQGNGVSDGLGISSDGRYVLFSSGATNLVTGDTNGATDLFVRDRQTGTTERVNVSSAGAQANAGIVAAAMSGDGRYVTFASEASNLVDGDTNGQSDIFIRDRTLGTTERIGVASSAARATALSMSEDGRRIAFLSDATGLVTGDTNGVADAFLTVLSSTSSGGGDGSGTGGGAENEVTLSETGGAESIVTNKPVVMPLSGVFTSTVTLVGSGGCKITFFKGLRLVTAGGLPFVGRIYPPSVSPSGTPIANSCSFTSSGGTRLGVAFSASVAVRATADAAVITLPLPPGARDGAAVRVTKLDDATGAITTHIGTVSGSTITYVTNALGTFGSATVIDLGLASTAPSVTSDIPVRFPGKAIGPAVTLTSAAGSLAIPAGTIATVQGAPFSGTLAPPSATTLGDLSVGMTLATDVVGGIALDRPATLTLTLPSGRENDAFVPVTIGSDGGVGSCLLGSLSGSGVATEIAQIAGSRTYALRGTAKPLIASVDRATAQRAAGYHAAWASQSAPTAVCPRQQVEVTVRIRNTGDVAWTKGTSSQAVLGTNSPPGNTRDFDRGILITPLYNRDRFATHAEDVVRPGDVGTFTFVLRAPSSAGSYPVEFRALIEGMTWMEDEGIYFDVVVR